MSFLGYAMSVALLVLSLRRLLACSWDGTDDPRHMEWQIYFSSELYDPVTGSGSQVRVCRAQLCVKLRRTPHRRRRSHVCSEMVSLNALLASRILKSH